MNRTDSRITSACSDAITLSTACSAVILPNSAIVVLLRQSLGRDRRFDAPDGRTSSGAGLSALLHHFYRHDPRASHSFAVEHFTRLGGCCLIEYVRNVGIGREQLARASCRSPGRG